MLSVNGKSQIQIPMGLLALFLGAMIALVTPHSNAQYEAYDAAGRPPMNKLIYNSETNQWGYWSVPGGPEGFEEDDGDPEPLERPPQRLRRPTLPPAPRRTAERTYDDEVEPRTARPRRALRAERPANVRPATPAPADVSRPVKSVSDEDPWNTLPSASKVANTGKLETDCEQCDAAVDPIAAPSTAQKARASSREILRAAKKAAKGKAADDEDYQSEYEALADGPETRAKSGKQKALTPFVRKLLENAKIEANKKVRRSKRGLRYKRGNKGMGLCLQGVRMALQHTAGESDRDNIGTDLAKYAGRFLISRYGYTKGSLKYLDPDNAPVGSILIYDAPKNRRHPGHIEIKGEDAFYSDYRNVSPLSELSPGRRRLIGIYTPPKA